MKFDFIKRVVPMFRKHKIALLLSLCNVVILLFLSYVLNNQPLFTGEDLNQFACMEIIKNKIGVNNNIATDDALFVNVAYDKQLVDVRNEYDMPNGNIDITDRSKLLQFLKILHSTDQYAYIFLDVRFEKGMKTPDDSLLFAEINDMRNIVVPNHDNIKIADDRISKKSGINDYNSTIVSTNFVRYKYRYSNGPSMALYAYTDLTNNDIKRHGLFYTCGGKLCYNSLFIDFPKGKFNEYDENGDKTFYNLGAELLGEYSEADVAELTKGKNIVIGDFIEDLHDTYSGMKPGSVITYYAFKSLVDGKHFVSFLLWFILAMVYFVISFAMFSRTPLLSKFPFLKKVKSSIVAFIASFLGYSFVLALLAIVLNLFWNVYISIIVPSFIFALEKLIIKYKDYEL